MRVYFSTKERGKRTKSSPSCVQTGKGWSTSIISTLSLLKERSIEYATHIDIYFKTNGNI